MNQSHKSKLEDNQMHIKFNIGQVEISGLASGFKADFLEKNGGKIIGWFGAHDCGSKAFAVKSPFKRDDAWSQAKGDHVLAASKPILDAILNGLQLSVAAYVAPERKVSKEESNAIAALRSAHAVMKAGGMDEAVLKAAFPSLYVVEPAKVEEAVLPSLGVEA